jgi:Tfp pilus tip-associated adhesin PilY1
MIIQRFRPSERSEGAHWPCLSVQVNASTNQPRLSPGRSASRPMQVIPLFMHGVHNINRSRAKVFGSTTETTHFGSYTSYRSHWRPQNNLKWPLKFQHLKGFGVFDLSALQIAARKLSDSGGKGSFVSLKYTQFFGFTDVRHP